MILKSFTGYGLKIRGPCHNEVEDLVVKRIPSIMHHHNNDECKE